MDVLAEIKKQLKNIAPKSVYVFGSYAFGVPRKDSDLDLCVVLDVDKLPENYQDKMNYYRSVRRLLLGVNKKIPLDLFVYTKPEWENFKLSGSSFSKEVLEKGKSIL